MEMVKDNYILGVLLGLALPFLGFTIFYNIKQTNKFKQNFNVSLLSGEWSNIKTNITKKLHKDFTKIFRFFLSLCI